MPTVRCSRLAPRRAERFPSVILEPRPPMLTTLLIVMCLFMSMDKVIGGQFDQGLAKLDAVSRAGTSVAQV